MTKDDVFRLAAGAGFIVDIGWSNINEVYSADSDDPCIDHEIHIFAALVAAAEREACAQLCEKTAQVWEQYTGAWGDDGGFEHKRAACQECVNTIRARGL
jgi:DNA-binding protein YbaB